MIKLYDRNDIFKLCEWYTLVVRKSRDLKLLFLLVNSVNLFSKIALFLLKIIFWNLYLFVLKVSLTMCNLGSYKIIVCPSISSAFFSKMAH